VSTEAGPQVVFGLTSARLEDTSSHTSSHPSSHTSSSPQEAPRDDAEAAPATVRSEAPAAQVDVVRQTLELGRVSFIEDLEADGAAGEPSVPLEARQAELERESESESEEGEASPQTLRPRELAAHATALPTPDEMSIPPMGDLLVEPVAERFFSEGEIAALDGASDEEWDEAVAHKAARKGLPEVIERRARLAKYVRWAVGGAAVLCLAAVARITVSGPAVAGRASAHKLSASPALPAPPSAAGALPVAKAATPEVAEPSQAKGDLDTPEGAASAPASPTTPDVANVVTGDKTALQEKTDARRALEGSKPAAAIAAGERSVALDPTDGEAWLLLGAAYQESGKLAEARRCYAACAKQGKRGPLEECRAMLR
jgi:hypothetical protein